MSTEIFPEYGKSLYVILIIAVQFKLHVDIAGPAHAFPVQRPGFRAHKGKQVFGKSGGILGLCAFRAEECSDSAFFSSVASAIAVKQL